MELLLIFVPQETGSVDENGNFRKEFLGMEGYATFAKEYHESRMQQSFQNISAVLSKREMDELGWQ